MASLVQIYSGLIYRGPCLVREVANSFGEKLHWFNAKKIWIVDFCNFQYGPLNEENLGNKPHQSYIALLKKHRLWIDYTKGMPTLSNRVKEKEKEKDKEKDKEKEKEKEPEKISFEIFWDKYDKKIDRAKCEPKWNRLTRNDQELCLYSITDYVNNTPDKKYRRDPETYLNNRSWENEIIKPAVQSPPSEKTYQEMLVMAEKDPGIWTKYTAVRKEGARQATFKPIL